MSEGRRAGDAGNAEDIEDIEDDDETWSLGYAWVTTCSVEDFVERVQAMREGERPVTETSEKPRPANAIRAMHAFALKRPIDQLIESARCFDYRDAVNILATAALGRKVKQAAGLAIKQWDAQQSGAAVGPPLTDGIIHDIACQRTALDVAVFVRECRRAGKHELVDRTLRFFVRPASGRTSLDKALLYIALRDEKCGEEADDFLRRTLKAIEYGATQESDIEPAEFHDLVGALHQLSPTERILEEWVDAQLRVADRVLETRRIVAHLIALQTDGPDSLVEHVGRRLSRHDIVEIGGQLAKSDPLTCAAIREHAASRDNVEDLAEIVIAWHRSAVLTRTTKDLLADIVTRGSAREAGPRSPQELDDLGKVLGNFNADPECRRMLWIAAATHVGSRSGADLVALLGRVERPRDRRRAAQTIAQQLTAHVLEDGAEAGRFVEYVRELRRAGSAEAVYQARKELADPSLSDRAEEGSGEIIAEIAARLYAEELERDGWDLLERCLENEQRVTPQDVAMIVDRLHASTMHEDDRHLLLRATVGRWSDTHRREQAVEELRRGSFVVEAAEVIRALR